MIRKLSYQLADWSQKQLHIEEKQKLVIEYGLQVFLDGVIKFLTLFGLGLCFKKFPEVVIYLISFCGLRYWAGGVHCKTSFRCLVAMVFFCFGCIGVSNWIKEIPFVIWIFLWIVDIGILLKKAPGETGAGNHWFTNAERENKKAGALIFCMILFIWSWLLNDSVWSSIIEIAASLEVVSILPCKGNKYNTGKGIFL